MEEVSIIDKAFIQNITLDIFTKNSVVINAKQGDGNAGFVRVQLAAFGATFKAKKSWEVSFRARKQDGHGIWNKATVEDEGTILFALTRQTLACPGMTAADVNIRVGEASETTMTFWIDVEPAASGDNMTSKDEFGALIEAIVNAQNTADASTRAENVREENESNRKKAETERAAAEAERKKAESERSENTSKAIEEAKAAAAAALHPPILKDGDDHWWVWSVEENDYVRSEADAGVSLTIGTVTTGEPGTAAKVTNRGTATDPILDFTIPQGQKGDKGDKGDVGPKGDTGSVGPTGPQGPKGDTGGVTSVNGQTGAVTVTPGGIGAYTKAETDTKLSAVYTKAETDTKLSAVYTKAETDTKLSAASTNPTMATQRNNFTSESDFDSWAKSTYAALNDRDISSHYSSINGVVYFHTFYRATANYGLCVRFSYAPAVFVRNLYGGTWSGWYKVSIAAASADEPMPGPEIMGDDGDMDGPSADDILPESKGDEES